MKTIIVIAIALAFAAVPSTAQTVEAVKVCQVDTVTNEPVAGKCFTIPAPVMTAFNSFMAAQTTTTTNAQGESVTASIYPGGLFDLLTKHFINSLVLPILDKYPTPELAAAKAQAASIAAQIDSAKAAILAQAQ